MSAHLAHRNQLRAGAPLAMVAHQIKPTMAGGTVLSVCGGGLVPTAAPARLPRPLPVCGSLRPARRRVSPFTAALQADPDVPDALAKNAKSAAASHLPI